MESPYPSENLFGLRPIGGVFSFALDNTLKSSKLHPVRGVWIKMRKKTEGTIPSSFFAYAESGSRRFSLRNSIRLQKKAIYRSAIYCICRKKFRFLVKKE